MMRTSPKENCFSGKEEQWRCAGCSKLLPTFPLFFFPFVLDKSACNCLSLGGPDVNKPTWTEKQCYACKSKVLLQCLWQLSPHSCSHCWVMPLFCFSPAPYLPLPLLSLWLPCLGLLWMSLRAGLRQVLQHEPWVLAFSATGNWLPFLVSCNSSLVFPIVTGPA